MEDHAVIVIEGFLQKEPFPGWGKGFFLLGPVGQKLLNDQAQDNCKSTP